MGKTAEMVPLGGGRSVDTETGEILDLRERPGMFVYVPSRPKWGEGWFMAIQEAFVALAKDRSLSGRPMRVLTYMMGRLNWDNYITLTQAEIAGELDLHQQDVSDAVKLLVERGIIQQGDPPQPPRAPTKPRSFPPSPASPAPQQTADEWGQVRAALAEVLTPENYARWFAPTHQMHYTDGALTVAVPDAFHLRWLDERLRAKIEACAAPLLPGTRVLFVVEARA